MGTPAGHPLSDRGSRGVHAPLAATAHQRPRREPRGRRTHCAAAQNPRQSRLRRRRRYHRRTPRPRHRHHENSCPIHYLAHPDPLRFRGPTTAQTTSLSLETLLRRTTQPALASRRHPLALGRPHRGRNPQPARRPLTHGTGQPGPTHHDRPRRGRHLPCRVRPLGHPGLGTDRNGAIFTATPRRGGRTALQASASWASTTSARAPIAHRPAARSNAFTKPSKNASPPYHRPDRSPNYKPRSTISWPTTPSDHTGRCTATPPSKHLTPGPRPSPTASRSPRTTAYATTASMPPA